ncbi:MAG: arginine--tRNA ligase, partial [Clostridia bacterium]|nr:arginine--tRNA ligase [Clostridia bacterium]
MLKLSDGAKVVDLADYNMPPCLIVKKDGATLYATRDLAAAFYRKNTYDFYKCLYVVAYQQNLHFKQVFKVLELLGKPWAKDMEHVAFGMVSLEDGAMSTRKGKVVLLNDVL